MSAKITPCRKCAFTCDCFGAMLVTSHWADHKKYRDRGNPDAPLRDTREEAIKDACARRARERNYHA